MNNIHPCQTVKLFCEMQDSALQKMPLASGVRGIDYLNNLTAFQDLVSKSQVKKWPMIAANTSSTFNSFALITITPQRYLFLDPHDITRYFGIWYDYHTISAIFYDSWSVQNLSKNSAKCVICMSNTHNGTRWMHQMHKSGIKYANSCKRYVLKNAKSQVILILEANWRQFTLHTSLLISCDIFKKNAISIF